LVLAALWVFAGLAEGAPGANHVKVFGSVSGKTLTVNLRARPFAKCNVWLGSGKDRARLPRTGIGVAGRGLIEWPIPSSTPTGKQPLSAACGHSGKRATGTGSVDIPVSAVSSLLTTVLNVLLDVILALSLVVFLWALIDLTRKAPDGNERFTRALALVAGALVALGAQASGVGFASYIIDSLTGAGPGGEGVKLLSILIPGGAALVFGWFFLRAVRYSTMMALRWMTFLGMLTIVSFTVIFAEATNTEGVFLGAAAIPNTSFVVGLIFSVLAFRRPADAPDGIDIFGDIVGIWRRTRSSDAPSARRTRNPFTDD
jgi:hypothetical protein